MNGYFKKDLPYNNVLLFFYALLLHWRGLSLSQGPAAGNGDAVLYRMWFIGHNTQGLPQVFFAVLSFLLLFLQALMLNGIANRQKLMPRENYLPGMCFLLFSAILMPLQQFSASLIANTLLLWVLSMVMKSSNHPAPKTVLYNTGVILGIAILLYSPSILFISIFLLSILILRPFVLREWVLGILGILTPFYFLLSFRFLKSLDPFWYWGDLYLHRPFFNILPSAIPSYMILLFMLLSGILYGQKYMQRHIVLTRRSWSIVYLTLIVAFFMTFFGDLQLGPTYLPALIPFSLIGSCAFFYPDSKWFVHILHWSLFILAIKIQYFSTI